MTMRTKSIKNLPKSSPVYAGFWLRLGAILFDNFVVLAPLTYLFHFLAADKLTSILFLVVTGLLSWAYCVICLGLLSRTLGMKLVGIKVFKVDLGTVGWKEALLRYVVDLLLALAFMYVQFPAFIGTAPEFFIGKDYGHLIIALESLNPIMKTSDSLILHLAYLWTFSEVIVLLMNRKKRAIHDFIAGTVVTVQKGSE